MKLFGCLLTKNKIAKVKCGTDWSGEELIFLGIGIISDSVNIISKEKGLTADEVLECVVSTLKERIKQDQM